MVALGDDAHFLRPHRLCLKGAVLEIPEVLLHPEWPSETFHLVSRMAL